MRNMTRQVSSTRGPEISVVIPTYNRCNLVCRAVDSALRLAEAADVEVIVIDDQSSDDTMSTLALRYRDELAIGRMRLQRNAENAGVTASKNAGVIDAVGEWIMFLDSDDVLRKESIDGLVRELRSAQAPLVFFRCLDADGRLIGRPSPSNPLLTLEDILTRWVWGECLPVVRRSACRRFPYDADLRGFEGLAYYRITRALGPAVMSAVIARTYNTSGGDRLSSRAGLKARSCLLARGHGRVLREFGRSMGAAGVAAHLTRMCFHALRCCGRRTGMITV